LRELVPKACATGNDVLARDKARRPKARHCTTLIEEACPYTNNPMFHARTKHVEIDLHFVRDKVQSGGFTVKFISTKDQIADIFTKLLVSSRFASLYDNLTVTALPFRLRGPIEDTVANHQHQLSPILKDSITTESPEEISTKKSPTASQIDR
jgi:hypothetical protein